MAVNKTVERAPENKALAFEELKGKDFASSHSAQNGVRVYDQ